MEIVVDEIVSIGKKCSKCGFDLWMIKDENTMYKEFCTKCANINILKKQDFIDNFQCPDCNCLEGTLEENKNLIAVRCKYCGKQVIVLEKHTTVDHRTKTLEKQQESSISDNTPKCPTCGSANIKKISATKKLGGVIGFGIFSKTARSQFECLNCKYKW